MRKELCKELIAQAENPSMIFLTGDLGFMALEPLQARLGQRFINAGVAEQNMVSVAAAMAKDGWQSWCYSIAPFLFARPFEQIRNDVCLHDLPVKLIGNGGGYGYGVMGPTHHAIEDYGVLLGLPFMKVFLPCFNEDVAPAIRSASKWQHPCYVRLGLGELPAGETAPEYEPWRRVLRGNGPVMVAAGPIAGSAWSALRELPDADRPDLWIVAELPLSSGALPEALIENLRAGAELVVVEEHIAHGGLGAMLIHRLTTDGVPIRRFTGLNAPTLALNAYGSQTFLRQRSGLAPEDFRKAVLSPTQTCV